MKRFMIALGLAVIYLVVGNVITFRALYNIDEYSPVLDVMFAPYGFVILASTFNTWDRNGLFIFEGIIFVITIPFFYGMVVVLSHIWRRVHKRSQ